MPTPAIFSGYSRVANTWYRKNRWPFFAATCVIAFAPAVLERTVPSIGPTPGRVLFFVMVAYLAAAVPLLLFRPQSEPKASPSSAWARAIVCNVWLVLCLGVLVLSVRRLLVI